MVSLHLVQLVPTAGSEAGQSPEWLSFQQKGAKTISPWNIWGKDLFCILDFPCACFPPSCLRVPCALSMCSIHAKHEGEALRQFPPTHSGSDVEDTPHHPQASAPTCMCIFTHAYTQNTHIHMQKNPSIKLRKEEKNGGVPVVAVEGGIPKRDCWPIPAEG